MAGRGAWFVVQAGRGAAPVTLRGHLGLPGLRGLSGLRLRALLALLGWLSRLAAAAPRPVALRLCSVAGAIWYAASPAARGAVYDNLCHVLHRPPSRREVRRVFFYGALNYWDTLAIRHLSRERLLALVDVLGTEHLDAALAAGHGVVLISAHLGSVSLAGQALPALGYPIVALIEPIRPPELFDFFVRYRQTFGGRTIAANGAGLREVLASLRRNEVVGLISDRDVSGTGKPLEFFGALTGFPDGAAAFALRTGAPVLSAINVVLADGRMQAIVEPPLPAPATGDARRDVQALTRSIADRLEYHIASHPEQWTVFQKRWPDA